MDRDPNYVIGLHAVAGFIAFNGMLVNWNHSRLL